jgi:hypothetical protein
VMYGDGKILLMGGKDPPTNTAEVIDLNLPSPTWRSVSTAATSPAITVSNGLDS